MVRKTVTRKKKEQPVMSIQIKHLQVLPHIPHVKRSYKTSDTCQIRAEGGHYRIELKGNSTTPAKTLLIPYTNIAYAEMLRAPMEKVKTLKSELA